MMMTKRIIKNHLFFSVHNTILNRITEVSGFLRKKKNILWHISKILRYLNVFGLPNINPAES